MLSFTRSADAVARAYVHVTYRIDTSAVAEAAALWAYEASFHLPRREVLERLRNMSAARSEELLARRLRVQGPPDRWDDAPDDDQYNDLRDLADARIAELFGDTPTN